ncbi:MAG: MoaD/ThiS family protein [Anaerolineae bacterium]|nr:MoaD/ThiS family protein [Anaerolineae bacterium]MDW8100460.1 MoaD/ThiS family protein [Anaerolineae bacterium]
MPVVWIPALLRELTGGQEQVVVPGETVRQVIESLEARFPGIRERLMEGDRLRPGLAVVVDDEVSRERLRHRLTETSEVHFVPAISGGK